MKSLISGLDSLAVANKSLLSLYNPTVVIYDCGELTITLCLSSPDPVISDGFVLKGQILC